MLAASFIAKEYTTSAKGGKSYIRTFFHGKDDVHLTARRGRRITDSLADVGAGVVQLDIRYLQAAVDVPTARWQRKTITANPTYSGT